MVSLKQTSLKYHGKKAETYDAIRTKQARWKLENEVVARWLDELRPTTVLDCPVGTGRFFGTYADLGVKGVHGIDVSEEMLALADTKVPRAMRNYCDLELQQGSATEIPSSDLVYDCTVCVRFLDLIDEDAMRAVVKELCRVTRGHIICTIRLGDSYVAKSNTAEHDAKKFRALVKRCGFHISKTERFREGSWHILLLERT